MREILNQVEQVCLSQGLIPPYTRLLVSCSGGQDSITLLFLLCQLQPSWNWKLGVMYCNHLWRHESIDSSSKLLNISFHLRVSCSVSVAGSKIQTEDEARVWRLRVLSRVSDTHIWNSICTGHTASDRIETLISNLLRGASSWGVRSLNWYQNLVPNQTQVIPMVRPLLGISRHELRNYANRWKLPLCYDPSNQDQRIRRNRIRHELLPYLRYWWNPQIDKLLAQNAEVTSWETIYYDLICTQICQQYEWIGHAGVRFPWKIVQSIPRSLHSRMIWIFLNRASIFLNPFHGFQGDFSIVNLILERDRCSLLNGDVCITKSSDWIQVMLMR